MAMLMAEQKAKEIAAENNKSEEDAIDGAWSYDAVAANDQKRKALVNNGEIDAHDLPLSAARLWVVEVYDEGGEYLGTL